MAKIISRNYRDRSSEFKWLVRDESEEPSQARAFKSVQAKGVRFQASGKFEQGFGCNMVAIADEVNAHDPEPIKERIHFTGARFSRDITGATVERASALDLHPDGSMFAVIA